MKIVESTENDVKLMQSLEEDYVKYSGMRYGESLFLTSLVRLYKPQKVLEIGVGAGSSSVVLLNATKDFGGEVFAIDFAKKWYRNPQGEESEPTGFVLEKYPNLKRRWHPYLGHLSYEVMPQIGKEIDFCLIDTVHIMPGEILDYLMVLPHLKDDCVVVLHDVSLPTAKSRENNFTTTLLISAIRGEKLLMSKKNYEIIDRLDDNAIVAHSATCLPNIAAVVLNKETKKRVWEIFNLLTIKWEYFLEKKVVEELADYFRKNYNKGLSQLFIDIVDFQVAGTEEEERKSLEEVLENKRIAQSKCSSTGIVA